MSQRALRLPTIVENLAQSVVGLGIAWIELQGSLQEGHDLLDFALLGQGRSQDYDRFDRARFLIENLAALGDRAVGIAGGQERTGQTDTTRPEAGGQPDAFAPLDDGFIVPAGGSQRNRQAGMAQLARWEEMHGLLVMRDRLVELPLLAQKVCQDQMGHGVPFRIDQITLQSFAEMGDRFRGSFLLDEDMREVRVSDSIIAGAR